MTRVCADKLANFVNANFSKRRQTAQSWVWDCPNPGCKAKAKLYIRKRDGEYICFKCKGQHSFGSLAKLLAELTGLDFRDVHNQIYGVLDGTLDLDDSLDPIEEENDVEELTIIEWPEKYLKIDDPDAYLGLKYLQSRGVSLEIANYYSIRYSIEKKRVCFPVYDGKDLIGWQGRLIYESDNIPKALTSKGLKKGHALMFASLVPYNPPHLVVCEGPIDAIKMHFVKNAVATMGKGVSSQQIKKILDLRPETVYLGLDSDAFYETEKLYKLLKNKTKVKIIKPLPALDLGAMTYEQTKKAFEEAEELDQNLMLPNLE